MAKRKSGNFTKEGIESLAKDKPVVYKIEDSKGKNLYTGIAKRGRVGERLAKTTGSQKQRGQVFILDRI